jgi:hypothetical protein
LFLTNTDASNPFTWNFGVQSPLAMVTENPSAPLTHPSPPLPPPPPTDVTPPSTSGEPDDRDANFYTPEKDKKDPPPQETALPQPPILSTLLDAKEEARQTNADQADLLWANAPLEERKLKMASAQIIDATRNATLKLDLVKAEADRSMQTLQTLERETRLRLQAKEERKKGAVEAILKLAQELEDA